jgi:hypothetical protein
MLFCIAQGLPEAQNIAKRLHKSQGECVNKKAGARDKSAQLNSVCHGCLAFMKNVWMVPCPVFLDVFLTTRAPGTPGILCSLSTRAT